MEPGLTFKSELFFIAAGPAIPSVVAYPKRSQTSTADGDIKADGAPSRRAGGSAGGGKGMAPASPMLGNASNPNKADIPERKTGSTVPSVSGGDLQSARGLAGEMLPLGEPADPLCHRHFLVIP